MHRWIVLTTLAVLLRLVSDCSAALVVNPPQPITHRVSIQIIQTALDDGTSPAPVFGSASRQAAIESNIDTIWAQAGIDVSFLPEVTPYPNTFAYQGLGGVRPLSDLSLIISGAQQQDGILNSDSSVINMFFVRVAPGFDWKASNWVTGASNLGINGIAVYVGTSVSAEHAAHWVSHEIGHNLGLVHTAAGVDNLMGTTRTTAQLTDEQVAAIYQTSYRNDSVAYIPSGGTGFPQSLPPLAGDFNGDGRVDAADYVVLRNTGGTPQAFDLWRTNFNSFLESSPLADSRIPEPAGGWQLILGAACLLSRRAVRPVDKALRGLNCHKAPLRRRTGYRQV